MTLRNALGLGVISLFLLSACGQTHNGTSQEQIFGGTKVPTGEWMGTVALTSFIGMHCSGTAITPTVVITAGHCAHASIGATYVYTGDGAIFGLIKGQTKATKVVPSPLYDESSQESNNDISYVLLEKPLDLPADAYVPVLVDKDEIAELLQVGKPAHLVGYGSRDDGGLGKKYEADTTITAVGDNELSIGGNGIDTCQGDSGGPVYSQLANGQWRVYGVTSRGGACGTGGIYGRMDANICWVQKDSGQDLGLPAGFCDAANAPTPPTGTP